MRSHAKDGSINETIILNALNNHHFKDLSDNWKRHIKRMFKDIQDDDFIKVNYYEFKDAKPDLEIIVKERHILLSIKSGHAPTVHHEPVATFFSFLRELNVPERIINIILFYHYGYSRGKRYSRTLTREEILKYYPNEIKEVNDYFASHDEIVSEIIYRSILRGRLKRDLVDYFYYGNAAKGFLLSVTDIYNLIIKVPNNMNETIHFKQLTYVSGSRDPEHPRHHNVKINWPILCKYFYDEKFMKRFG